MRFSPSEEFLVIWAGLDSEEVYVHDPTSGKLLRIFETAGDVCECTFVGDADCVILTFLPLGDAWCLRLFNIRSGDLLSLIDLETWWSGLIVSHPEQGLIASALQNYKTTKLQNSEDLFKVIQTRLSGYNRDSQRSLRSVITYKCGSHLVNDFLHIF